MTLSPHFELSEFTVNSHKMIVVPTTEQQQKLQLLCLFGLERIRERFGYTQITSGVRSEELNRLVGGVPTSQHTQGEAADFICPYAPSMGLVLTFIRENLQWPGQAFYYKKKGHCHISLPNLTVKPVIEVLEA